MFSMTLLAMVLEFSRCQMPDIQSAPLKLVYLALGYGAAMAVANALFSLGPWMEARMPSGRVAGFRRWSFGGFFGISVTLPILAPLIFLIKC